MVRREEVKDCGAAFRSFLIPRMDTSSEERIVEIVQLTWWHLEQVEEKQIRHLARLTLPPGIEKKEGGCSRRYR